MVKITYRNLRPSRRTIDAIVGSGSKRIELSTGVKLPPYISFDSATKTFKGGAAGERMSLESQLFEWERSIRDKHSLIVVNHGTQIPKDVFRFGMKTTNAEMREAVVDTRATLSAFCDQIQNKIDKKILSRKDGKPYADNSLQRFESLLASVKEFSEIIDFDFAKYNLDTEKVLGKSRVIEAYDEFAQVFKNFLRKKEYGDYAFASILSFIKSIINDRCEHHGIAISRRHLDKFKSTANKDRIVIVMSDEQFEWIINNEATMRHDFRHLRKKLVAVDYILAGLLTAARIADLDALTMSNLQKAKDGSYTLRYIPLKTKNSSGLMVEVPVAKKLLDIFLRNAEKSNGKLLPPWNITCACRHMREVLKKYEIFQEDVQTQDKHGKIVCKPFWEAFKFHGTRGSLITYLLSQGEQETAVKSISGHTIDSSSFKRYAKITSKMKVQAMAKVAAIGM
jgi:hypothetical protein